jgi:hypothetical protein
MIDTLRIAFWVSATCWLVAELIEFIKWALGG